MYCFCLVPTSGNIWSSTQYSSNNAYNLNTGNGNLNNNNKNNGLTVRAFVQIILYHNAIDFLLCHLNMNMYLMKNYIKHI